MRGACVVRATNKACLASRLRFPAHVQVPAPEHADAADATGSSRSSHSGRAASPQATRHRAGRAGRRGYRSSEHHRGERGRRKRARESPGTAPAHRGGTVVVQVAWHAAACSQCQDVHSRSILWRRRRLQPVPAADGAGQAGARTRMPPPLPLLFGDLPWCERVAGRRSRLPALSPMIRGCARRARRSPGAAGRPLHVSRDVA